MNTNVAERAARAGGALVSQLRSTLSPSSSQPARGRSASGWLVVTVLCEPSDLDEASLPAPLSELGDQVEVRVRQAPGGRGTELSARRRDRPTAAPLPSRLSGNDPQAEVRSALRRAKQLIEVGEVLVVDPAPHGERPATPGGQLLEAATEAAPGAGVR